MRTCRGCPHISHFSLTAINRDALDKLDENLLRGLKMIFSTILTNSYPIIYKISDNIHFRKVILIFALIYRHPFPTN